MVPELNPPGPAKKFFTKMAKSFFGKKKSKGMYLFEPLFLFEMFGTLFIFYIIFILLSLVACIYVSRLF